MDMIQSLRRMIKTARRNLNAALEDLNEEAFNAAPPGTANPIRAILLHIAYVEDMTLHAIILKQPTLWEKDAWNERFGGIPAPIFGDWGGAIQTPCTRELATSYLRAVQTAIDAYLDGLTPEGLDAPAVYMGRDITAGDAIPSLIWHTSLHTGDIATVKGVLGLKGLPI